MKKRRFFICAIAVLFLLLIMIFISTSYRDRQETRKDVNAQVSRAELFSDASKGFSTRESKSIRTEDNSSLHNHSENTQGSSSWYGSEIQSEAEMNSVYEETESRKNAEPFSRPEELQEIRREEITSHSSLVSDSNHTVHPLEEDTSEEEKTISNPKYSEKAWLEESGTLSGSLEEEEDSLTNEEDYSTVNTYESGIEKNDRQEEVNTEQSSSMLEPSAVSETESNQPEIREELIDNLIIQIEERDSEDPDAAEWALEN